MSHFSDPKRAECEKLEIAPMIDWTNTHFRYLMRLLAPKALLYTEMQTTGAIFNNQPRALQYHALEHPLVLQLGGSDPDALVKCALIAEAAGFNEINLNLGCPSDRVQAGRFGACLMAEPSLVATCIERMKAVVQIPVTAKTRIGIDKNDSYEFFENFAKTLINSGIDKLIVHARKAWLKGLNPKQNRTIPPLHYDFVYKIKKEAAAFLPVIINGNINQTEAIQQHLNHVDGVMIGRLACQNPYAIARIHHMLYPACPLRKRSNIFADYIDYGAKAFANNTPVSVLLKPVLSLAHGLPGARHWKEKLTAVQRSKQWRGLNDALLMLEDMEAAHNEVLQA